MSSLALSQGHSRSHCGRYLLGLIPQSLGSAMRKWKQGCQLQLCSFATFWLAGRFWCLTLKTWIWYRKQLGMLIFHSFLCFLEQNKWCPFKWSYGTLLNGSSKSVCSCKMRRPDSARVSVPDSLQFTAEIESKPCKIHRLLSTCMQWVCKSIYDSENYKCFWWDLNI